MRRNGDLKVERDSTKSCRFCEDLFWFFQICVKRYSGTGHGLAIGRGWGWGGGRGEGAVRTLGLDGGRLEGGLGRVEEGRDEGYLGVRLE